MGHLDSGKIPARLAAAFAFLLMFSGCSLLGLSGEGDFWGSFVKPDVLLVLVEPGAFRDLGPQLEAYRADLSSEGVTALIEPCGATSAGEALDLIKARRSERGIDGVFLVGDLPSAWYEMSSPRGEESFPFDLYFEDLDARWYDADSDGRFDSHSTLKADIFVSRIPGSSAGLVAYFGKLHAYRSGALAYDKRALLFKDDDWASFEPGSSMGLRRVYADVEIRDSSSQTTKAGYRAALTGRGIEFVNQWIHAYPRAICIKEPDGFHELNLGDVRADDYRGLFYNLFDCSAARFTEENLAETYLVGTEYGLAALGSTKVGGAYDSRAFYGVLSSGGCWGEAYRIWYNSTGAQDDGWFLGMIILGDPTLTIHPTTSKAKLVDYDLPPDTSATDKLGLMGKLDDFQNQYRAGGAPR
jgi:hypothetical protein